MTRFFSFRNLTVLLLLGVLALPAFAQPQRGAPMRIADRLDLTETQRDELQALRREMAETARAWRADNPEATREDVRAFREEQRAAFDAALQNVLTPEQRTQMAGLRDRAEARRDRRGDSMRSRGARRDAGPDRAGDASLRDLDLSEAQREALRDLRTTQREAAQTWRSENPEATEDARRAFREEQRDAYRSGLESILTGSQRERLAATAPQRIGERRQARRSRAIRGLSRLDLSEDQREALQQLRQQQQAARDAWRSANSDATPEERAAFGESQRETAQEQMMQILTDEQRQQLATLREQRAERGRRGERGQRDGRRRGERGQRGERDQGAAGTVQGPDFELDNYPNPFNPSTEISFTLPSEANVTLGVYDLQGREVAQVLQGTLAAGPHQASFDGSALPSGVYLYRLSVDGHVQSGRMTLMK